jgi:hypothetical protein
MTDPYLHNREFFGTVSGNYRILNSDNGLISLVASILAHTIFVQKLHIEVTAPTGAELWTFQDGAGIPIVPSVSAAAIAHFDFDFGPDGVPCTESTALLLNITGAVGAIGWITWEGFKKLTLGTAASAGGGPPADSGTSTQVVSKPGLVNVSTDGAILVNPTLATAGIPVQISPRLRFEGQAWDTDDGVSRPARWTIDGRPVSGPNVGGNLLIGFMDPITGALTSVWTLFSNGTLNITGGVNLGAAGYIGNLPSASGYIYFVADAQFRFDNFNSNAGVGLDVSVNGTLRLRNRLFNADGQFAAASVRGNAVTFANLPAAPVEGMVAWVTDSTVNTWGTVIVGGGANHVLACYNGTNWTVAGK